MDKASVLKNYFGYSEFRPGQEQMIDGILNGRDVMAVMPTGGGKSLCYQLPALLSPGITLVVSPLISLMKDQVSALKSAGINAAFINSSLSAEQLRLAYRRMRENRYKIVYVAPERLGSEAFISVMQHQCVSLIAVDEAHCISQWGQDFRPSYRRIVDFLDMLPSRPVLSAFTATATAEVRRDILRILKLQDPVSVVTGFDRPNLFFDIRKPKNKRQTLRAFMDTHQGKSGIVYCATRVSVERVCDDLRAMGIRAARYHAGLSDDERRQNQEDFQTDQMTVMVATNAFGMGIDKSNIGFVVHYNMPKSLEAYYQEAGRAGRDGEKAECLLLYSAGDVVTAKFLIKSGSVNEDLDPDQQALVKEQDYRLLDTMVGYCKTNSCLRGYILDYFGQAHEGRCDSCGNCTSEYKMEDITPQAQMVLSCMKRVKDKIGYHVGSALIIGVLHGSKDKRILQLGLDQLSTYGLMQTISRQQIRAYVEYLESAGYARVNPEYMSLEPTERSAAVLFRGETVTMPVKAADPLAVPAKKSQKRDRANLPEEDNDLFSILKKTRTRLAQAENVPAYIVFSNAALTDMAQKKPRTVSEFLQVSGVGEVKADRYAKPFLAAIAEYGSRE